LPNNKPQTIRLHIGQSQCVPNSWAEWNNCQRGQIVTVCAVVLFLSEFLSMDTITHEPLHADWWNFARTCTVTTAWTLFHFKVVGQRSRPHGCAGVKFIHAFRCAWYRGYQCTVLSQLDQGLMILSSVSWQTHQLGQMHINSCWTGEWFESWQNGRDASAHIVVTGDQK